MFMGKITVKVPLVTWREGKPRFSPGPRLRKMGFKGEDLRHPDGRWFDLVQAIEWSAARQALIAATEATSSGREKKKLVASTGAHITLAELFELWWKEPRLNGKGMVEGRKQRRPLSPFTVRFYKNAAKRLEELDGGKIWFSPAVAITAAVIDNPDRGILHRIEVKHGLAVARGVRATLSALYGWAIGKGRLSHNPAKASSASLPTPAPRIRYGSIAEMKALVAAADRIGRHDVGDAIMLGLWTGQRQGDRLGLEDGRITTSGVLFRQSKKHGQPLLIPAAPELAARIEGARVRRRDWRVNYPHVVLDETARAPFQADWYRKKFRDVREAAVKACPSLKDFRDQDLRDTAVTWLALAGCSKIEIASITGHSLKSIDDILKHYLGMHPELARSAITKLVAWYQEEESQ